MSIVRQPAILLTLLAALLAGCATQPVYPPTWATTTASPHQVANTPENYQQARVIWGGEVISVHNKTDHTEVEILAFPLDKAQRPARNDRGDGRFLAIIPGYVDPTYYPAGRQVTVQGTVMGVHGGHVGQAPYIYPLLRVEAAHLWSADELRQRPNVNFNIGIGVGIH